MATATPRPARPTAIPAQPARVVSATLGPASVQAGATLTARVQTTGPIGRVQMYLGSGSPSAPAPITFTLTGAGGGIWTGAGTAPSVPGEYHYTVGIFVRGARTIIDNDAWNIKVAGASAGTSSTLPSDVPLAPPFSYGNPSPATFSAEGRTVSGGEVVSTTRTDVAPGTVSQWYIVHFPRAGWTVDPSTVPAAGAASFSMVATKGNRACVVEYVGSTVNVFYGTFTS